MHVYFKYPFRLICVTFDTQTKIVTAPRRNGEKNDKTGYLKHFGITEEEAQSSEPIVNEIPNIRSYKPEDQMERRVEFDVVVCEEMKKKTTAEWMECFEANSIWYAPVNEYDEVVKNEQIEYNQCFMTMDHPVAGEVKVIGHANRYDGKPLPLRKLPPELGEHTKEVLSGIGYADEEIEKLMAEGKIFAR